MRNLIARGRTSHWDHVPWQSRDYLEPIPCKCVTCLINDQNGHCKIASAAKLDANGQCETFLSFKAKPPVQNTPRCRRCGGPLVRGAGGQWEHDGEQLSHEVEV